MTQAARTIKGLTIPIDGLVCYPTVMTAEWEKTADGIESHFQKKNYLAYFVFVNSLLEALSVGAWVVLLTSSVRREAPAPRWEDINFASMFANIQYVKSLAQICTDESIAVFSANPGNRSGALLDNCEAITLPNLDFPRGESSAKTLWKQSEVLIEAVGLSQTV
ncbi:hypothetical protein PDE_06304 [Penicillium oxalicum 114-2]|uniref:Ketoreductase (KR) domain-containing protein n=1 Tax=Penicillium oxalicum (strain 114-2 / CGMCC 5302) TaxID=933388 RepID=S7ZM20_PENO1|nr:hypothetical protein PDE_06304 [Penicillium oxalicum 114-2]